MYMYMYIHKQGVWDSQMCPVYRGVLISMCPERDFTEW